MKTVFAPLLTNMVNEDWGPSKDSFLLYKLQSMPAGNETQRLEHFEILYIKRGPGTLIVDDQQYMLEDNTVYCLGQGQYRCITPVALTEGYCISVSREVLHLSDCITNYGLRELVMTATPELDHLIRLMRLEYAKKDKMSLEILRNLLKVFIILCLRGTSTGKEDSAIHPPNDDRIVKKFLALLQRDFAAKKHVSAYADTLCLSPNYLNAVVKRQTGFPASHHIQQHVIMAAKRYALYSDLRMKDIAEKLGFDDCSHFSRFFKAFSGVNFSRFRRRA